VPFPLPNYDPDKINNVSCFGSLPGISVRFCWSGLLHGATTRAVQGVSLLEGLRLSYASRMNTMVYVVGTAERNTLCPQERVVLLCVWRCSRLN
jgi:hypothetical protein